MQHFEVLLFLLFPGLVLGQNCLTDHAVENFGLDVNNTSIANTTVELIAELEAWSNDTCITACCDTHESGMTIVHVHLSQIPLVMCVFLLNLFSSVF